MRARLWLTIVAAVCLLVFLLAPVSGQQQRPPKNPLPVPDESSVFYPIASEEAVGSVPVKQLLKAGDSPIPPDMDFERAVLLPASAGTGGGDVGEAEPNNTLASANVVRDIPFECTGTIDHAGDADVMRVFVTAGEPIQITVWRAAGLFASPLDPTVIAFSSDGGVIDWNDDIAPGNHNAQVNFVASYTGDVYIAVQSAFAVGSPDHRYIVSVWPSWNKVLDMANAESEPNSLPHLSDAVISPGARWGFINPAGDVDYSYFDASAGATVVIDLHSSIYNLPLDAYIELYDSHGRMMCWCDDMDGNDPRLNVVIPDTGRYYVAVGDRTGTGSAYHFYILSVSLQDGTASPHITQLKNTADGRLKRVVGTNFDPASEVVEIGGVPTASVPAPTKPTTLIKVKPAVAVPVGDAVTVLVGNGRRSNPVFP